MQARFYKIVSMKNNTFGINLKTLRQLKNISQRKLGDDLNVCNQTISFWENGSREPDLDTLIQIAEYFDVSLDSLLLEKI